VAEDKKIQALRTFIAKEGLKNSRQRETIAQVFFESTEHIRVEDLLQRVRQVDPKVSQATVYRTMKLLVDCRLAEARQFQDGQTRYEASDDEGHHHDHLICTKCGKIVEFVDERIEELQEEVAASHGFKVSDHKMELYGVCDSPDCA
jgi:Fur family transcriptional regulator, ferric uptake regulator